LEELDFTFTAPLWLYQGKGAWYFITVPTEQSEQIKFFTSPDITGRRRRGWGAVKVTASIGEQTWSTSIFPSKERATYILPVKAEIRKKTGVAVGDEVEINLEIKTGL
jgi:hypothetical protein